MIFIWTELGEAVDMYVGQQIAGLHKKALRPDILILTYRERVKLEDEPRLGCRYKGMLRQALGEKGKLIYLDKYPSGYRG